MDNYDRLDDAVCQVARFAKAYDIEEVRADIQAWRHNHPLSGSDHAHATRALAELLDEMRTQLGQSDAVILRRYSGKDLKSVCTERQRARRI